MTLLSAVPRNAIGVQREIDNFRADSGAITKRNPDAWLITCAHAVIVIESYLIAYHHHYEHVMSAPRFFP